MRIICLKWGNKYSHDYVRILKAACERHIPHDEFVCLTDSFVPGVDCRGLQWPREDYPARARGEPAPEGWWAKIELFKRNWFIGKNLYLDLDVVVTDSITPFIEAFESDKSKLWALDDFSYSLAKYLDDSGQPKAVTEEVAGWLGGPGASTVNSSVMFWSSDQAQHLYSMYDEFTPDIMETYHGDQNYLTRQLWPDHLGILPSGVAVSYKYGHRQKAPIVVFHGNPKPAEVRDDWVLEHWTE